jgi:Bacterial toxin 28
MKPPPIGLAGGANSYGFASGDPVSYSDPFGLCPGISGTNQENVSDCPDESSRSFWDRLWSGPRYVEVGGQRYALTKLEFPNVGPAAFERSAATLARHSSKFVNAVKSLNASHLDIAARELAGEVTGWDHVTEVRSGMNAMRKIIRSMSGYLENPNLTAELRAGAEQLLKNAQDALRRAEDVIR